MFDCFFNECDRAVVCQVVFKLIEAIGLQCDVLFYFCLETKKNP